MESDARSSSKGSKAKPKPHSKYAPDFTNAANAIVAKVAIKNRGSGHLSDFSHLKAKVEELHLGDEQEWRPEMS